MTTLETEEVKDKRTDKNDLLYKIDDTPPWYICILLGFQHYLTMFGSTVAIPLILSVGLGISDNQVALGQLISTTFFVSGIITLLQSSVGIRLPIIQGGTFAFLAPALAIMSEIDESYHTLNASQKLNNTDDLDTTDKNVSWEEKMVVLQGSIMVASLAQIIIGATGLPGLLMKFIGPITIAPTVAMVGMGLWKAAANTASTNWIVSLITMALIILFSQYLSNVSIPVPGSRQKVPIFKLFPVFLAIIVAWLLCLLLQHVGYMETSNVKVLEDSPWFRVPYPGQYGTPQVRLPAVLGILGGVLSSMIESIGDYYACARLCKIRTPPKHAINRGIFIEGIGCLIAGAFGTGNGSTSYSENVGAIGITRVGSRLVVQVGAVIMMILAVIGKFGAIFTTIPSPVVGGMFFVMFGMITAVGLSSLKNVDLDSTRNLIIVGFSIFVGLAVPGWIDGRKSTEKKLFETGIKQLDQIILIFFKTSMFLSMVIAFFLDNTIPGTLEERGLASKQASESDENENNDYNLPRIFQNCIDRSKFLQKIPLFSKSKKRTSYEACKQYEIEV